MKPLMEKHWHHLPRDEVLDLLDTNAKKGLDRFEVEERQQNFGPNVLTQRKGKGPLLRFLLQFHQALVYILLAAVGDTGTIMMVTHSSDNTDPCQWQHPPVPEAWWQTIRDQTRAYDPLTTPTRGLGVVPELFRTWREIGLDVRIEALARRANEIGPSLEASDPSTTAFLAVAGALLVLVLMKLLSVAWIVVRYHGFTLRSSRASTSRITSSSSIRRMHPDPRTESKPASSAVAISSTYSGNKTSKHEPTPRSIRTITAP